MSQSLSRVARGLLALTLMTSGAVNAQDADTGIPTRNVNVIGDARPGEFAYDPLKQQNEPSVGVNPANPLQFCIGYNDYRAVDFPAIGDAWMGMSCTRDGGISYTTELLPGHPGDPQYSLGLEFGADPALVSFPGVLAYGYLAADRDTDQGGLFIQRYVWTNKEDGSPVAVVNGPIQISSGSSGRFLDKVAMVGFMSNAGGTQAMTGTQPDGTPVTVQAPKAELGMAAALFVGNDNNDGTQIKYWRSDDLGNTWKNPTKLSESIGTNQGVAISVLNNTVCVVWRRFADVNEGHAIMYACSNNRGKNFPQANVLADICPFDQGTTPISFRVNSLPTITNDGSNFHVFWADRGFAEASGGPVGCVTNGFARVVYSTSPDGINWTAAQAVDDNRRPPDDSLLLGHQLFPASAAGNGEIQVGWIDTRDDRTQVFSSGFITDFIDSNGSLRRHTADVRTAKIRAGSVSSSVLVSQYPVGVLPGETTAKQLEYFYLNPRIFAQGSVPFLGDYLGLADAWFRQNASGNWESNQGPSPDARDPVFVMAWTDTRNIRGDAWQDLAAPTGYTPSTLFGEPDPTPDVQLECLPDVQVLDRTRDQNVYASRIEPGTVVALAGGIKPLGELQRAVPIFITNRTDRDRNYRLRILDQPSDAPCPGRASWVQLPVPPFSVCPPPAPVDEIVVRVFKNSGGARTLFLSSGVERPPIRIEALELDPDPGEDPQFAVVTLNGETTTPDLLNPDYENPDAGDFDILSVELHDPNLDNVTIIRVDNPDVENPDVENPGYENPDHENPDFENPDVENPDYENFEVAFPDVENPDIENSSLGAGDYDDGFTDYVWTMTNEGNTTTAYTAQTFITGPTETLKTQLLVTRTYSTPSSRNCTPNKLGDNQVLVNIPDPHINQLLDPDLTNPALQDAATFWLPPGFRGNVILRVIGPAIDDNRVGAFVNAQACNFVGTVVDCSPPDFLDGTPDFDPPVFDTLPIDIDGVEADGPGGAIVTFDTPTATDALDGPVPVVCTPPSGSTFELGTTTAVCVATDGAGNEAVETFDVTVVDTTAPALSVPAAIEAVATSADGAEIDFLAQVSASDQVDLAPGISCSANDMTLISPAVFPVGETLVTCTATDQSGNQSSASFTVTVTDGVPPEITVPADGVGTEATGPLTSFDYSADVSVSDDTDPAPNLSCQPPAGSDFALGDTTVNCTATDAAGNSSSASFVVTISDTTAPALSVPADISVAATGADGAVVDFLAQVSASDSVDPAPAIQCAVDGTPISSPATFAQGETTVMCTATDASGNSASASFVVTVTDGTPPAIVVPDALELEATAALTTVDYVVTVSDDTDPTPQLDCVPPTGSGFAVGTTTVLCTATDAAGNTSSADFTVTIVDTTAPILTVPATISAEPGQVVDFDALVSADDLVDPDPEVTCQPPSGSVFETGVTTVVCTATDDAGNTASASFNVVTQYGFGGLQIPYRPPPKSFKAGRTVPLDWNYTNEVGTPIDSALADPVLLVHGPYAAEEDGCLNPTLMFGGMPSGNPVLVADAGNSNLRYTPPDWQFNWETVSENTEAGDALSPGCYEIRVHSRQTDQMDGPFPILLK